MHNGLGDIKSPEFDFGVGPSSAALCAKLDGVMFQSLTGVLNRNRNNLYKNLIERAFKPVLFDHFRFANHHWQILILV